MPHFLSAMQISSAVTFPLVSGALHRLVGNMFFTQQYASKAAASSKSSAPAKSKAKVAASKQKANAPVKPAPKKAPAEKPARAVSARIMFIKSTSKQWFMPGQPATEGMRRANEAWKAMTDAERAPYTAMALESKVKAVHAKEEAKAKKPPPSAYVTFVQGFMKRGRSDKPGAPVTQLMRDAAAQWQAMPDAEKARLKVAAERAKADWAASQATFT